MEGLKNLEEFLESTRTAVTVTDLAVSLLRYCGSRSVAFNRAQQKLDNVGKYKLRALSTSIRAVFEEMVHEDLTERERMAVEAELRKFNEQVPLVMLVRAIAEALDFAVGNRFFQRFRDAGIIDLQAVDALPISRPHWPSIVTAPNSRPESLQHRPRLDELPHLRLPPALPEGFRFRMDFTEIDRLSQVFHGREWLVGAATLNETDDDFHVHLNRESGTFFPVVPKDSERQLRGMIDVLEAAEERGLSLLVFPELSGDKRTIEIARNTLEDDSRFKNLRLVFLGSHHEELNGDKVNVGSVFLRGKTEALKHQKFAPYEFEVEKDLWREELNAAALPVVTIYLTEMWSVTFLICKDFLGPECARVLEDLRVSLVLVAACSPKVQSFEVRAAQLTASQTMSVVANNPLQPSGVSAIFAAPRRKNWLSVSGRGLVTQVPGFVIYSPRDASMEWVPCASVSVAD